MKTIIKFSVFLILSFTAAVAVLNWDELKVFAHTGKKMIEEKIDEAASMETKLSILETRIDGLDREIYDLKTEVVRRKVDVEYMDKIVGEKQNSLIDLKDALERASTLLEEKREYYVIGGRKYSHDEVARDAAEKLKLYKVQEETLENLRRTLDTKRKTLTLAEGNVAKGQSVKAELNAKVKFLKAQVERYKAKEIYAETVNIDDTSAEFKTLIGQTQKMLAEFEKQLEVKGRLLEERIRLGGEYIGGIDYTKEGVPISDDIAEEITIYFNEKNEVSEIVMDR